MPETCQVLYHHDNCINTKKAFVQTCHLCSDYCPHEALSQYREIDPKKCTECGVCMAVCPTDGMADRQIDSFFEYVRNAEEVMLSCPEAMPGEYEIPCLGMFDRDTWILLMSLAKHKPVTVKTGVCAECADRNACQTSIGYFKQLHSEWPEHAVVQIKVDPYDEAAVNAVEQPQPKKNDLGADRRDAFLGWKKRSMDKIDSMFPTLTSSESWPVPKSRVNLVEYLADHPEEKVPYIALVISDECTSCGVCAAICPQGAITKRGDGKEEPMRMVLEPMKCVQCERCAIICRPKAITLENKSLSGRLLKGKIMLHEGKGLYCERCGTQLFERSEPMLCISCANTDASESYFSQQP